MTTSARTSPHASTSASSVETVARELVELCKMGRNADAIDKFYAPDIVSVESSGSPEMPAEQHGIDAVRAKNAWWMENNEVHSASVTGPFLSDSQFAVKYEYETTFKPTGERLNMIEMALYDVANGRIVREHFFYNMTPQ